jgi:hypothetical protein
MVKQCYIPFRSQTSLDQLTRVIIKSAEEECGSIVFVSWMYPHVAGQLPKAYAFDSDFGLE